MFTVDDLKPDNMFTIEDLEPGMLVKLANGSYGVITPVGRGLAIIGKREDGRMSIFTLNIRFSHDFCGSYSVVEVYDLAYTNETDFFLPGSRKCLWRYEKERTIEEIEKELGYPVKIVKEH